MVQWLWNFISFLRQPRAQSTTCSGYCIWRGGSIKLLKFEPECIETWQKYALTLALSKAGVKSGYWKTPLGGKKATNSAPSIRVCICFHLESIIRSFRINGFVFSIIPAMKIEDRLVWCNVSKGCFTDCTLWSKIFLFFIFFPFKSFFFPLKTLI